MHSIPRRHRIWLALAAGLTIALAALPGSALAAGPAQVSHDRFEFTHEETNLNICGDLGFFSFSGTTTATLVRYADGAYQFAIVERGTYTLTFLGGTRETWDSRFVEVGVEHAPPGGTFTSIVAFNSFEGPIRIHEMTTFVVGPDGTVRVDSQTFVVDECPPV